MQPLEGPRPTFDPPDPVPPPASPIVPWATAAHSRHADTRTAAFELCERLEAQGLAPGSTLLLFASFHHRSALPEAVDSIRRTLRPANLVGTTAEAVIGGSEELEGSPGLSVLALALPEGSARTFAIDPSEGPLESWTPEAIRRRLGFPASGAPRAIVAFVDPFSLPATTLLAAIERAGDPVPPVFGVVASGSSHVGGNLLLEGSRRLASGVVGVTLAEAVEVESLVSTASRPIGRPMVVTSVRGPALATLGGRTAIEMAREATADLDEHARACLRHGLFVGVAEEEGGLMGRGGYLLRTITAGHLRRGEILTSEPIRAGRTIQFHLRDPAVASEDLAMLLDGASVGERPQAIALFCCGQRGRRLFHRPDHDAAAIRRRLGEVPLAGCMGAAELAPGRRRNVIQGLAAVAMMLRRGASRSSPQSA